MEKDKDMKKRNWMIRFIIFMVMVLLAIFCSVFLLIIQSEIFEKF